MKADIHTPAWMWPAGPTGSIKRYPFGLLLGLSLLIHLLVLAGWPTTQIERVELSLPVADFAIHLQQAENQTETIIPHPASMPISQPVANPEPVSSSIRTRTSEHRQTMIIPEATVIAAQTEPTIAEDNIQTVTRQASSTSSRTTTEEATSKANHSRVISRLQHELKQYFYYPRLAQQKKIQGTVVLGFAINLQGILTHIRIVKSSGFAILDMAAEDALLKLHHLDWDQNGDQNGDQNWDLNWDLNWQANNSDLKLPVIYQLTEG